MKELSSTTQPETADHHSEDEGVERSEEGQLPLEFSATAMGLISTTSFLLGLPVGHWLTIRVDKRKEFNAMTETAFLALRKQVRLAQQGAAAPAAELQVDLVETYFKLRRGRFRRCVERYQRARDNQPRTADAMYPSMCPRQEIEDRWREVTLAAEGLLHYLKRR